MELKDLTTLIDRIGAKPLAFMITMLAADNVWTRMQNADARKELNRVQEQRLADKDLSLQMIEAKDRRIIGLQDTVLRYQDKEREWVIIQRINKHK